MKALIPDRFLQFLTVRLQLVAGGRGQPQGHVGGQRRSLWEEARATAKSPSQPSRPEPASFHHWQSQNTQRMAGQWQGPDLDDIPSTASSLHSSRSPHTPSAHYGPPHRPGWL